MTIKNNLVTKISAIKLEYKKADLFTSLNLGFIFKWSFPKFSVSSKIVLSLRKKKTLFRFKVDKKEKKIIKPMLPPKIR